MIQTTIVCDQCKTKVEGLAYYMLLHCQKSPRFEQNEIGQTVAVDSPHNAELHFCSRQCLHGWSAPKRSGY